MCPPRAPRTLREQSFSHSRHVDGLLATKEQRKLQKDPIDVEGESMYFSLKFVEVLVLTIQNFLSASSVECLADRTTTQRSQAESFVVDTTCRLYSCSL